MIDAPPAAGGAHPRWRRPLLIGLAVVLVVGSLAWFTFQRVVQPNDPQTFYTPPATLPTGPAGTLIRNETLPSADPAMRVWRVLYTSTDDGGHPIAVSGVIAAPTGAPPPGGWPIVAWAHGTVGVASRCANSTQEDGGVERIPELAALVTAGNVLVATDYPGIGTPGMHPYLIGRSEGRSVLDSIRAGRNLLPGDTSVTSALYGHSQGGHATLFAAALAPTYAPELHIVGAAPMAPPTDLAVLLRRDAAEPSGIVLTALAVASWSKLYPQAHEDAVVHPAARPFVAGIASRCVETEDQGIADIPAVLALKAQFLSADPATVPGWSELFAANSPGPARITMPLLVSQGLDDTLVRPDVTTAYVTAQCTSGSSIELDTYARVGHFEVRTVAAPAVLDWLLARLHGEPSASGCSTVTH